MHLSIDPQMNIHQIAITETEVSDSEGMERVMLEGVTIDKVIADGAFKEKSIYAFHKKYGYGSRCLVESQISRIKRCIGSTLLTQLPASQEREGIVIANIINLWNAFGRPASFKKHNYVHRQGTLPFRTKPLDLA